MTEAQFNPVFDGTGAAQFTQTYTTEVEVLPPSPTGVTGWVAYTGDIPALSFANDAPLALRGVQIWDILPTKQRIDSQWRRDVITPTYPNGETLVWPVAASLTGSQKSAVGPAPEWSYTGAQYDADGVSVGAVPAWHVGKGVWCGPAYTQMLTNSKFIGAVAGTPGTLPTGWTGFQVNGQIVSLAGDAITLYAPAGGRYFIRQTMSLAANTTYVLSVDLQNSASEWIERFIWAASVPSGASFSYIIDGVATAVGTMAVPAGSHKIQLVVVVGATSGNGEFRIAVGAASSLAANQTATFSKPIFTTPCCAPYVASGTAGPVAVASAAGTSGGNGLAWPKTTKLDAIYDGQGTVACKVTLGTASSAVTADTNILTVDDTAVGLIYAAASNKLKSNDGTNTAEVSCTWAANDELLIAVELLASTFRIGFAKTSDSAITWGTAAPYDGSHNSGTGLRLALLNTIPMWAYGVYVSSKTGLTAADIRRYI